MKKLISLLLLLCLFIITSCKKTPTYTVKFLGINDTIIQEKNYDENDTLVYPTPPNIEGYTFTGWDQDIQMVTENLNIHAIYEKNSYKITFKTIFDTIIETKEIAYQDLITYPEAPIVEGYTFIGWDQDLTHIKEDTTITALYQPISYTVTFETQFGDVIEKAAFDSNEKITYPKAPIIEGYEFVGWDYNEEYLDENKTIVALYEKQTFKIVFKTQFGDIISEEEYEYLDTIIYPEPLVVEGYNFVSWDLIQDYATSNLEIVAFYNIMQFTVTFYGLNNVVLGYTTVNYMKPFMYVEAPIVEGYTFIGWDQDLSTTGVKQNTSIHAIYEKNNVDVNLTNYAISNAQDVFLINGVIANNSNENIKNVIIDINGDRTNCELDGDAIFDVAIQMELEASTMIQLTVYVELVDQNLIKILEEEYLMYVEISTSNHISYVDTLNLSDPTDISDILQTINPTENYITTLNNIIYGGFRNTDELHAYDATNYRSRNSYGHEVAIDANGFVIDSKTLVDLPEGGYILSGHGVSANLLQNNIAIGDYIIYNQENQIAEVYRSSMISNLITLRENISLAKTRLINAYNELLAIDYQTLFELYNQVIEDFKTIIENYDEVVVTKIKNNVAKLHFGVVENKFLEVKAFWHYPLRVNGYPENNKDEVCRFLDDVARMGFNTIYINTNFNGGSIYPSAYLRQLRANDLSYDGYNDYLECFIAESHKRNLRVIAWTNTFVCGDGYLPSHSPSRLVALDYHGKNNSGNIYFYDITNSEVQELLVNVYSELASKYELDGIEYDFVRYPASNIYTFSGTITNSSLIDDFCYTETSINEFKKQYGITGDVKSLILTSEDIRNKWQSFKVSNVTNMVRMISTAIKESNPDIMISAAVMSGLSGAIQTYSQDFGTWVKEGYVDNLDPMMYSGSNSYVQSRIDSFIETIGNDATIVIGISPDNSGGNFITISEQIEMISQYVDLGFNEFSSRNIFSSVETMNGFTMLQRDYNITIYASPILIRQKYAESMLDRITNFYQYTIIMPNSAELVRLYNLLYSDLVELDAIRNELAKIENERVRNRLLKEFDYVKQIVEG